MSTSMTSGTKNARPTVLERFRLALLAFMGKPDLPRWLRERDEARKELDQYRQAANLSLGEFVGAEATVERIADRFRTLEGTIQKLRRGDEI